MEERLKNNPTWLPVVAAAIVAEDGRILMHRRPFGKQHGGLWEFPGGKVEAGETPASALVREIKEELGLDLVTSDLEPVAFAESESAGESPAIVLLLYKATQWSGEPVAHEGGEWGWFTTAQAKGLSKPPLDVTLLKHFTLVERWPA